MENGIKNQREKRKKLEVEENEKRHHITYYTVSVHGC
jgi:hypothetical protein